MSTAYQPKTGAPCTCRKGLDRDNCPACEGTGQQIDFAAIRARKFDEKTEAAIAKFDREEAIRADLPAAIRESASICAHKTHVTVTAWNDFRTEKKLRDAVALVREMAPSIIEGEHWQSGCISTYPAEINEYAQKASATMNGSHAAEILVEGGEGYGPIISVRFWVKLPSGIAEIRAPFADGCALVPQIEKAYNRDGELTRCEITWPAESRCADSFRKWWSSNAAYRGSYYIADLPNFYTWASNQEGSR